MLVQVMLQQIVSDKVPGEGWEGEFHRKTTPEYYIGTSKIRTGDQRYMP